MSDVRQVPTAEDCARHNGAYWTEEAVNDYGIRCALCIDERDAAVDELIAAAREVVDACTYCTGIAAGLPEFCKHSRLRKALEAFGEGGER